MKQYQNEREFIEDYDASQYDLLSLTTDILVFSIADGLITNYRKLPDKLFSVLLVKRKSYPFKDRWCLPGGFLRIDEDLEDGPKRILIKETNLSSVYLEQLYTFGAVDRDPRLRVINTAYLALVDKDRLYDELLADAAWFNIKQIENDKMISITLSNEHDQFVIKLNKLNDKIITPKDVEVVINDDLAFDNALVLAIGINRLRNKLNYTDIVFNMMPDTFTLKQVQKVYEAILDKKLHDQAFRRLIKDKVIKTDQLIVSGGHRPSILYRRIDK